MMSISVSYTHLDITDAVEKGETYKFSFWAKLSDDYKDAPEEQRNVEFAPFYVSGGEATYLGSYSAGILSGDCTKTLKAGEMCIRDSVKGH